MRILLAPDSFKGTFSSQEMISILSAAARRHFPDCEILGIPIADGGEGTLSALLELHPEITDPPEVIAKYGTAFHP